MFFQKWPRSSWGKNYASWETSLQAANGGWSNPEPSGNVILSRSCHQHPYDLVAASNLTHSRHGETPLAVVQIVSVFYGQDLR